ncbi:hypothetical protein [Sorangium cellulosum]|uniref:hypothetical protein n=1 Tax=Sorangium cellulosum TaxID=56 RepID=UPI000CF4FC78|nr:hypothetical protein [Sorangium cellulosum]
MTAASLSLCASACSLRGLSEEFDGTETPAVEDPSLVREAEAGQRSGAFFVVEDSEARGGAYVRTRPGTTCSSEDPNNKVRFEFEVDVTGDYQIRTGAIAPDELSDSFLVRVDDAPDEGYLYMLPNKTGVIFSDLVHHETGQEMKQLVVVPLKEGVHAVEFFCREPGAGLDWIALERR